MYEEGLTDGMPEAGPEEDSGLAEASMEGAEEQPSEGETDDEHRKESPVYREAESRAKMLLEQREALMKATGVDAAALFQEHRDIQEMVLSGKWDFADVVRVYGGKAGRRTPPAPVRRANDGTLQPKRISAMSSAEFEELNEKLRRGEPVDY